MTTSKSNWFDLKLLCPLLIAAACLWDAGMRFFPERIRTFRAWESALPMATAEGDFRPLLVYDNPQAFGDLSNLANCESCRVSRRERFTTDTRGFRNPPGDSNPYTMVLTGDSFGVGSSLSDEDTLSRQLDRILPGQHVYNASAQKPQWGYALKIIEAQGIRNSFLIWEHAQLHPFPTGPIDPPISTQRRLAQKLGGGKEPAWYPTASGALKWARAWFTFSPLKMTVQRGLRHAELHGILPSGSPSQVSRVTLTNGKPMLSYDAE